MLTVERIDITTCKPIISSKHYSKTLGIFWEGFGLYDSGRIVGVVCYGQPSPAIQKHAFRDRSFRLYELTRLVIDSGVKNGASILISGSLKILKDTPCAVVSYADTSHGHSGIVYQATNWLYTGATVSHDNLYLINGEVIHSLTLQDRFGVTSAASYAKENSIQVVKPKEKHRYFYFVGNKYQKRDMMSKLAYPIINAYPKSDKVLYESNGNCSDFISSLY